MQLGVISVSVTERSELNPPIGADEKRGRMLLGPCVCQDQSTGPGTLESPPIQNLRCAGAVGSCRPAHTESQLLLKAERCAATIMARWAAHLGSETQLGDVRPLSALVGLHTLYRCYTRACLESTATIRAYSPSHRRNSRGSGFDSAMCLRVLFASPLSPWISAYRRHGGTLTMGPPPGLGTA